MIEKMSSIPSVENSQDKVADELERKLLLSVGSRRDFANAVEKTKEIGYVADRINTLFHLAFKEAPEGADVSGVASEAAAQANEALAADNFGSSSQDGKIKVLKNLIQYRQGKGGETASLEEEIDKALLKEIKGHYPSSGNRQSAVRELRDRYIQRRDYDAALELAGQLEPEEKIEIFEPLLEQFSKNGTNRDTEPLVQELKSLREQVQNQPIKDSSRSQDYQKISRALSQPGLNKQEAISQAVELAKKNNLFVRSSESSEAESLQPIVRAQIEAGLLDEALETAKKIRRESTRSRAIGSVAETYMKKGDFETMDKIITAIPYRSEFPWYNLAKEYAKRGMFDKALEAARTHNGSYAYLDIAKAQRAAGIDPIPTLQEAKEKYRADVKEVPQWSDLKASSLLDIAEYEREIGINPLPLIQEAREMYGDKIRPTELAHIAKLQSEGSSLSKEDKEKLEQLMPTLLKRGRDDVAHAIGFIAPELMNTAGQDTPPHMRHALELGKAEWEKNTQAIIETGNKIDPDSSDAEKRSLSRSLRFHDYGSVSNELLRKIDQEKDFSSTIRYLKTLIEIENPKGRTFATKLYANPNLPAREKEYLARKLLNEEHWDKELGVLIEKRLGNTPKEEIDAVLTKIINDLNLTPDATVYGLLEKQGLLREATLDGRVAEIAQRKEEFRKFNRDELLNLFKNDQDSLELYYIFFGGEHSYSLINNYTFDKFKSVINEITSLEVDDTKMEEFKNAMKVAGKNEEEISMITKDLLAGRFPLVGDSRTFSFESAVEMGSEYAKALNRLQEAWGEELKKILILVADGKNPENVAEVEAMYSNEMLNGLSQKQDKQSRKVAEIITSFGIGEKQDRKSILAYSERMKKELLQRARQRKDKVERDRLETLPPSHIISEYFSTVGSEQLRGNGAYSEWTSHISEVLTALEQGEQQERGTGERGRSLQVDATFLDKGKDFMRAVRFADGQQCCFNSGNYGGGTGASKWIARLNRDPLSFVIDIKEKDAREISGFVFGRMGIDPEKKTPIVMLNGIYSRIAGKVFVDNLLSLIEEKFARQIGASAVVLASKHGGSLTNVPSGYEESDDRRILGIRALEDEDQVYDDIGTRSNGEFRFVGYQKELK